MTALVDIRQPLNLLSPPDHRSVILCTWVVSYSIDLAVVWLKWRLTGNSTGDTPVSKAWRVIHGNRRANRAPIKMGGSVYLRSFENGANQDSYSLRKLFIMVTVFRENRTGIIQILLSKIAAEFIIIVLSKNVFYSIEKNINTEVSKIRSSFTKKRICHLYTCSFGQCKIFRTMVRIFIINSI